MESTARCWITILCHHQRAVSIEATWLKSASAPTALRAHRATRPLSPLLRHNLFPNWRQGQHGKLQVLHPEGDADNGHEERQGGDHVADG